MCSSAPGGKAIHNSQRRLAFSAEISMAHRVAIHRRVVERWQVNRRDDVGRKHAPARSLHCNRLGLRDRYHALVDQPFDVLDRKERPAERKAIVSELGHQACPRASTPSRGCAFATRISAIVSMSLSETTGTRAATVPSLAIATIFESSGASSGLPTNAR